MTCRIACLAAPLLLVCAARADWPTFGGDPQRTGWAQKETELSKDSVKSLQLAWKIKLDNESKELNSLTAPLVKEKLVTPRGFKDYVVVAGSSDKVFAIDADNGKLVWQKAMTVSGEKPKREGHWLCPNALNATPVVASSFFAPSVFVLASDGQLHAFNMINGEDAIAPVKFTPPFSKTWSLNYVNDTVYTTTSQGCGGAKSGVWSLNLKDPQHPVKNYQATTGGGGIWGRGGAALTKSGLLVVETGDGTYDEKAGKLSDAFIAVDPQTMERKDYYVPTNYKFIDHKDLDMGNMSPVAFTLGDRELIAGAGKEGVIYLLDAKSLGGEDHHTPLYRSPLLTNEDVDFASRGFWGALSTWEDEAGTRWLLAPAWGPKATAAPAFPTTNGEAAHGSVMAFKVENKGGKPVLTPAWQSRDMEMPEPVAIANGVVFAVSSGENTRQVDSAGKIYSSKDRATTARGNAVLYALDAATGKELWSSGKTMTGFTHFSGIAIANGHVYVSTYDNTLYSFGVGEGQPSATTATKSAAAKP